MQRYRPALVVATMTAFFGIVLAVGGPARADSGDELYLETLKANNLSCGQTVFECPQGDDTMIAIGHQICTQLGANSKRSIASLLAKSKPGLDPMQATVLVVAAETAYCPKN